MAYEYVSFGLETTDVVGLTETQRTAVELQVTFSVADEATWLYKNFKHPRFENFYGYCQLMSGAYVVQDIPLQFLNQELLYVEYDTFDINDNMLCLAKEILAALPTPAVATGTVTKHRSRFTSLRFRLLAGVKANIGIRWVTAESNCGNVPLPPDPEQNRPAAPNNANSNPGSRPADQGGDRSDPSDNDGNYDPDSGNPPAPAAGAGDGTWHVGYTGFRPDGTRFRSSASVGVTDPTAVITTQVVNIGGTVGGHPDKRGRVFSNGVLVTEEFTGGDFEFTSLYFI